MKRNTSTHPMHTLREAGQVIRLIFCTALFFVLGIGLLAFDSQAQDEAPTQEPAITEDIKPSDSSKPKNEMETDFFSYFSYGGRTMWFITVLAILGLIVITERAINLQRSNLIPTDMPKQAKKLWADKNDDGLKKLTKDDTTPLGLIVAFCAAHKDISRTEASESAGEIASRYLRRQLAKTYWLAVIATLSPLLGLLGTVLGMIDVFEGVAVAGDIGDVNTVAGGIARALVTTAAGLIVAVPALAGFHFFRQRVNALTIDLEETCDDLVREWYPASKS